MNPVQTYMSIASEMSSNKTRLESLYLSEKDSKGDKSNHFKMVEAAAICAVMGQQGHPEFPDAVEALEEMWTAYKAAYLTPNQVH